MIFFFKTARLKIRQPDWEESPKWTDGRNISISR